MVILNTILTVIYGLLMLMFLVIIHEGGHFLVGKKGGFKIDEFSVGMGPKLLSRQKGEITYSWRALPIGGFVQFNGEDEAVDAETEPRAFNNMPIWKRFLTILAGPLVNILFAFILTIGILVGYGDYVPEIMSVREGYPAYEAGLQSGDRIVMLNGKKIDFSMEFSSADFSSADSILLGVERSDGYHEYEISTVKDEETGRNVIGITYNQSARKRFGFFEAIKLSFKWLWLIVKEMFQALHGAIFGGDGISNLSGPVGTIAIIGESVRYGFEVILRLLALLSLNLGIINLLPFPALDGGRIVLLGVEKLIGRPLNRKVEGIINLAGLVLLLILMVCLTYQDITRLL